MKRIFVMLFLALCLTACGTAAPENPLEDASGLDMKAGFLAVDDREVTAGEYLYWLGKICRELHEAYDAAGEVLDWNAPAEEGTLGDYVKEQALASAALYATVENWAERYGCAVTEETEAAISADWAEKAAAHGGEENYLTYLAGQGLDRAGAEHLARIHYLYVQLCELAAAEGSGLWATEEELAAYFREQGYVTADMLTFAGEDAPQRAAEVFSRLNGSGDLAANFAAVREEQDGEENWPRTFLTSDADVPFQLAAVAAGLEVGQLSGIVDYGEGYGIVLRLADDAAMLRQALLDHQLQTAAETARITVTEDYQALDVSSFWAELEAPDFKENTALSH